MQMYFNKDTRATKFCKESNPFCAYLSHVSIVYTNYSLIVKIQNKF